MRCDSVRERLSPWRDGDLPQEEAAVVRGHLQTCHACAEEEREMTSMLEALSELPRLEPSESVAARVLNRLEVESRGPGLALLFRSAWKARPLILPSLVPAALVLVTVVAAALALDHGPNPPVYERAQTWGVMPPSGTEANPLPPVSDVSVPVVRGTEGLPSAAYEAVGVGEEESFFIETVVARDGSVSAVNLLGGDMGKAAPVMEALSHERFEPGRLHGRPVAVSLYRLISRVDVRPPVT